MELRQLRYFVRAVELGSMGRAASSLGLVTSALSQQLSRLETELSTRLLQRSTTGITPTDAGLGFYRQAQLALRHVDSAVQAAKQARLSGHVSVGLAPTTAAVLGLPFLMAMRERHPDVRVHMVEALSGHLAAMLNSRQLDLAVVFQNESARGWSVIPLLDERLFVIGRADLPGMPAPGRATLKSLLSLPLVLPTGSHGLRVLLNEAFSRSRAEPRIVAEIDGLALLMDAVRAGVGATLQPSAALARPWGAPLKSIMVNDAGAHRQNLLASLSDNELSPGALAARVTLVDVVRKLVRAEEWTAATLHEA
jgi:LysR family transcriptional regulator, regulatory protein for tcuABC